MKLSQGVVLGFFFVLGLVAPSASAYSAGDPRISFEEQWERLIYFNKTFRIENSAFLLSYESPSPAKELELTIDYFQGSSEVCKYPARYSFLLRYKKIKPIDRVCPQLKEYWELAPADEFKYVLAGRSVDSITSMMGHGFLVAEGEAKPSSEFVSHSYAFYTDLREASSLTLAYDAFIGGMRGSFALRPYQKDVDRYLNVENREIWELYLDLDESSRQLLRDSLWELKDVEPAYYFQSFNCATLTLYTLAIVNPDLLEYETLFVSPEDIYKALRLERMVSRVNNILPVNFAARSESYEPLHNPQDSISGVHISNNEMIISFTPASHSLRTIFPGNQPSSQFKIVAFDYNLSEQNVESFYLLDYLDLKDYDLGWSKAVSFNYSDGSYKNLEKKNFHSQYLIGVGKELGALHFGFLAGVGLNLNEGVYAQAESMVGANLSSSLKLISSSKLSHFKNDQYYLESDISLTYRLRMYELFVQHVVKDNSLGSNSYLAAGIDYYF